jgi:hypothetical protein
VHLVGFQHRFVSTGLVATDVAPSPLSSTRATATPAARALAVDGSSTVIDTTDWVHVHDQLKALVRGQPALLTPSC